MLSKFAAKSTDPIGRKALELAWQLPHEVDEARAVLKRTVEVFEDILIRSPHELWDSPAIETGQNPWVAHVCALAWTAAALLLLGPIAAATAHLTECEASSAWILLAGVVSVALVFGRLYGLLLSVGAALAHNLLTIPPFFEFQAPSRCEIICLISNVLLSIGLPLIASTSPQLRLLLTGGRVPTAGGR